MSARKGQNLCQVQTEKCPHTISYLFDYRSKAEGSGHLFSQSIVQGAWVHPLASMINSFSASFSAVTNAATIVPRQNAILGQKVPHWTPFSKTCPLTTCLSLVFELTATKGFKKLIKDRKHFLSRLILFISLTRSQRFCILMSKLKYGVVAGEYNTFQGRRSSHKYSKH